MVEAVTYSRALHWLIENDYIQGEEKAALLDDAQGEIDAAVAAAAVSSDPTQRRIQREARSRS